VTTIDAVLQARQQAAEATDRLRATALAALTAGQPLRQVAIAADVSRQTLYNWQNEAKTSP
jgi:DNA invertase Pin-like site-specific DNA recombinase